VNRRVARPYAGHPFYPQPVEVRIGDADRESAVHALGEHYVAGRLTKEEFDERCDRAWQARTPSQLAPLFADLPRLPIAPSNGSKGQQSGRRRFRPFPVLLLLVVLAALTPMPWYVVAIFAVVWWSGLLDALHGKRGGRCFR
jgi:Domain of unknown function (DUF1707)